MFVAGLLVVTALVAASAEAEAQVVSVYRPVRYRRPVVAYYAPAPVAAYYAPAPVYVPAPVTSYYAPAPVYAPAPLYAPAPVVIGRPAVVRSKVYYPGRPVRNFFRAVTP